MSNVKINIINPSIYHCYECGKVVSIQELWDVDFLIETSRFNECISDYFGFCSGNSTYFHDNGAFNYLDIVNICKTCFYIILGSISEF